MKSQAVAENPGDMNLSQDGAATGWTVDPPVDCHLFESTHFQAGRWPAGRYPLAAIVHGPGSGEPLSFDGSFDGPCIDSCMDSLDGRSWVEVLSVNRPVRYLREGDFDIAVSEDVFFAAAATRESDPGSLEARTQGLYEALLQLIQRHGFPHILRIWHTLSRITEQEGGEERYRQFCLGRHEAIRRVAPRIFDSFPAATGVGSHRGDLTVYVVAARDGGQPVENPNQVSAYRYPARYGPRSPSFARALVKKWPGSAVLFLSGTASIVGHESRHRDHLAGQVAQALDNFETLVQSAARDSGVSFSITPESAVLKFYVRRPEDTAQVRAIIAERWSPQVPAVYLHADICRPELLFELEGMVTGPT